MALTPCDEQGWPCHLHLHASADLALCGGSPTPVPCQIPRREESGALSWPVIQVTQVCNWGFTCFISCPSDSDVQPAWRDTLLSGSIHRSIDCGVLTPRRGFGFSEQSQARCPYTATNVRARRVGAFHRELLPPHFHSSKRKGVGLGTEIVTFCKYHSVLFFRFTLLICIL